MKRDKSGQFDQPPLELCEHSEVELHEDKFRGPQRSQSAAETHKLQLRNVELELQNEELRHQLKQLQSKKEYFANLYHHAPTGYLSLDDQGRIKEANFLAAELLGTNRKSLRNSTLLDHIKRSSRHKVQAHLRDVFNGTGVHHCVVSIELPTHTTVHLKMMSIAVDDEDSGSRHCRSVLFDITREHQAEHEKHQLQEQLHETHRMETLGRLASGIAHDFNNLLTLIIGYSKLVLNQLPDDAPFVRHITEINKAGHHAAELIDQLLAFSRSSGNSSTPVAINELILDIETMLDRLIGDDIELVLRLYNPLGVTHFDSSQFQQVLMNLVVNAREAMPDGGRIVVRSRNAGIDAEKASQLGLVEGPYVIIEVEDNGNGIPPEIIPHIFEPFFTTKSAGTNHGFGLSTTYGIVRRHEGIIDVESAPDQGTLFSVYLPRVDAVDPNTHCPIPTVLVVDDQPDLRDFATLVLGSMNLDVLSARGPGQALELARAYGEEIDLLVTDVTMPGMNGPTLHERIRQNHPGAGVLYISGHDRQTLCAKHNVDPEAPFLEKPFTPEHLRELVKSLLDDSHSQ